MGGFDRMQTLMTCICTLHCSVGGHQTHRQFSHVIKASQALPRLCNFRVNKNARK